MREVVVVSRLWITLTLGALSLAFTSSTVLRQEPQTAHRKKIWTTDDVSRPRSENAKEVTESESTGKPTNQNEAYRRENDPRWYAKQLLPLRRELDKVERNLRGLIAGSKSGTGGTSTVSVDQLEEGISEAGEISVLQKLRAGLLSRIDDLEEQSRHKGIPAGEIRRWESAEQDVQALDQGREEAYSGEKDEEKIHATKEIEEELTSEKKLLENANKEVELLQREQKLEQQKESSKAEASSRRDPPSRLSKIARELPDKDARVQELQERVADLEDRLEDVKRRGCPGCVEVSLTGKTKNEGRNSSGESVAEGEQSWRRQFAEIDYKIGIARSELDILQRELNLLLMQYYANPATGMKEGFTRRDINQHRAGIEAKKKELSTLKNQREDLEDALRHAGGPAGWAR